MISRCAMGANMGLLDASMAQRPLSPSTAAGQAAHFATDKADPALCFFDGKDIEILKTQGQISPKMQSYSFIDHSTLCKMQS